MPERADAEPWLELQRKRAGRIPGGRTTVAGFGLDVCADARQAVDAVRADLPPGRAER